MGLTPSDSTRHEGRRGTLAQALRPFALFVLLVLVLLQVSRLALVAWQFERVEDTGGLGIVLGQGLRFDLVALGLVLLLPGLVAPLLLASRRTLRFGELGLRFVLSAALVLFVFLELATPSFIEEYDTRPNFLLIEYLKHPREVFATLLGAYPFQLVLAAVMVPLVFTGAWKLLRRSGSLAGPLGPVRASLLALGLPVLCLAAARSTLDHRPVNPSTVCFSNDALVNTLPLNSLYSTAYAIYELERHESGDGVAYGRLPADEVLAVVRRASGIPAEAFTSSAIPTLHVQNPTVRRERPLNLIIVLEESLGAEFVGALGGLPLTPHLDALLDQGLAFDRLYATGTRSVRGIEAVVTGFFPTPARSVVKLPRSQHGFFTIAELLARTGYATSFLYGGESHFDNMRRFFTGNGFERVIDENDFPDPDFVGSWGVSDQDLFRRAHAEFEAQGERPFFSLVFSSSNHSPWDFPADEIELYEEPADTRNNAVKYADHALGEFFELARGSSYWQNTVFLVVADHNSRVYGPALVPVERFHIPAVFLGGSIEPEHIGTLASQVDLLPTALSLLGLHCEHPALGRDLSRADLRAAPGRAMLQFHDTFLFLEDERAVVLRPRLEPLVVEVRGERLIPDRRPFPELVHRAMAHALWPQQSYRQSDYTLPRFTSYD